MDSQDEIECPSLLKPTLEINCEGERHLHCNSAPPQLISIKSRKVCATEFEDLPPLSFSGEDSEDDEREPDVGILSRSCFAEIRLDKGHVDDELTSLTWLSDKDLIKKLSISNLEGVSPQKEKATKSDDSEKNNKYQWDDKPPFPFSCLIFMAIENSSDKMLPVKEIYNWILEHFPYFRAARSGWKNSVRHNLSLNKCFKKIENGSSKSGLWCVDPKFRPLMSRAIRKSPYITTENLATFDSQILEINSDQEAEFFEAARALWTLKNGTNLVTVDKDHASHEYMANNLDDPVVKSLYLNGDGSSIYNRNRLKKSESDPEPVIHEQPTLDHTYSSVVGTAAAAARAEEEEGANALLDLAGGAGDGGAVRHGGHHYLLTDARPQPPSTPPLNLSLKRKRDAEAAAEPNNNNNNSNTNEGDDRNVFSGECLANKVADCGESVLEETTVADELTDIPNPVKKRVKGNVIELAVDLSGR